MTERVLITGGAGFVGANLAVSFAMRHPDWEIIALDNLYRRGSELNLPRLREAGVTFMHGDVRHREDLTAVGDVSCIFECSAEPSVMAGTSGSPDYLVATNLFGAYHCLELARASGARMVFLSTSRVYPIAPLCALAIEEGDTRFELSERQDTIGVSSAGISEAFPLDGARTLYGSTKLSAELLIAEYAAAYGVRAVVNRFGVIAGPWQMGKVDQGVFSYWMLAHVLRRPLSYIGFGGTGKQVRDVLHIDDVVDLIDLQVADFDEWAGVTTNVGGGRAGSLSLYEATAACADITGRRLPVGTDPQTRPGDIPVYLSDNSAVAERAPTWAPRRSPERILGDIFEWVTSNETLVRQAL
jgi:CDP-paratose 2-epimerase